MALTEVKKALGALGGLIVAACGALASLQFLSGPASHDLAVVSAIAAAVLVPLGAYVPSNGPKPPLEVDIETAVAAIEKVFSQAQRATTAVLNAQPTATLTYAPSMTVPGSVVLGGVVSPPPQNPPVAP